MNSQSDPASVNFSWGGVLVPMGRRMVSLLGRWYYGSSTAFNKILLSVWTEHAGACFVVGRGRSMWGGTHHCSTGSTDRGTGGCRNRWNDGGFLTSTVSQKLHSAEKRGVEENVTLGFIPHPPNSAIVLGGSRIRAQRDLPHSLNVTSRVGVLLSSRPFWGVIVGNERAGKTFPERVGGGKATLHAGNASDVRVTPKRLFPGIKGEAESALQVEGERFCSGLVPILRDVSGYSQAGGGLPHSRRYGGTTQYLPPASCGK